MFCPQCRDEFRPGFTRCGACNVDLVERLSSAGPRAAAPVAPAAPIHGPLRLTEYCGFLSLDEARAARDRLRELRIRSEILVRESQDAPWEGPPSEEYWLRVDAARLREVESAIGHVPEVEDHAASGEGGFACGACGHRVAQAATRCPECGAHFDE